jgi:hypothetical protein
MRVTADAVRRFWIPGLLEIVGNPQPVDLRSWLASGQFQIYSAPGNPFVLSFAESEPVISSFAGEISRFSKGAAESTAAIATVSALPKSTAWALIQWYYSAFYAAHAILRMCGQSLLQLDNGHANRVNQIAQLYGFAGNISAGFHMASVDTAAKTVIFKKLLLAGGGSHEVLWQHFGGWLETSSNSLLLDGTNSQATKLAATKLDALAKILSTAPAQKHCWLSYVRNQVSYKHGFAAWFPYKNQTVTDSCVYDDFGRVPKDADGIDLIHLADSPIASFNAACRFIVALCFDISSELVERSPRRASFQKHGMMALKLLIDQA